MPALCELMDGRGFVRCRYCMFARPPGKDSSAPWTCGVGDNPGTLLDPDIAECDFGELVCDDDHRERQNA